jgi:hypothetical protein
MEKVRSLNLLDQGLPLVPIEKVPLVIKDVSIPSRGDGTG